MDPSDPPENQDDRSLADAAPDVRETYDRIASHFAKTREHPWPEVEAFVEGGDVDVALDDGCANGRHAELLAAHADRVLGLDLSRELLFEAHARATERGFAVDLLQGDAARLPIADDTVDLATYIATIHHLPTRDVRRASLAELARVLRPGGRAIVSAWSVEHDAFDRTAAFDTTVDWTLPGGETVPRYYHVYDRAEFAADVEASPLVAEDVYVATGNCYAEVRAPE